MAQLVKNQPAMRETWIRSLGWEDPLEKGKAIHSRIWPGEFNSMDCIVHVVVESWTRLSDFNFHTHTHTQLIHFVVQQKPTQHCKANILQLKKFCTTLESNTFEIFGDHPMLSPPPQESRVAWIFDQMREQVAGVSGILPAEGGASVAS